jgi:hypothetical protein
VKSQLLSWSGHFFYGTWRVIVMSATTANLPLVPILDKLNAAYITPCFTKIHFNIILLSMPMLYNKPSLPFLIKHLYTFFISFKCALHLSRDLITTRILDEYKLWRSSLLNFLYHLFTAHVLGSDNLSALFSDPHNLFSPYNETLYAY